MLYFDKRARSIDYRLKQECPNVLRNGPCNQSRQHRTSKLFLVRFDAMSDRNLSEKYFNVMIFSEILGGDQTKQRKIDLDSYKFFSGSLSRNHSWAATSSYASHKTGFGQPWLKV